MPKTIYFPDNDISTRSGIDITYYKSKREIEVRGWYDGFVGIEGGRISLGEFLTQLGITLKDCEKELS